MALAETLHVDPADLADPPLDIFGYPADLPLGDPLVPLAQFFWDADEKRTEIARRAADIVRLIDVVAELDQVARVLDSGKADLAAEAVADPEQAESDEQQRLGQERVRAWIAPETPKSQVHAIRRRVIDHEKEFRRRRHLDWCVTVVDHLAEIVRNAPGDEQDGDAIDPRRLVRTVTWNMAGARHSRSFKALDYSAVDLLAFADKLRWMDADVVCLQESEVGPDGSTAGRLAAMSGYPYIHETVMCPSHMDTTKKLAIAFLSRLPIEEFREILLPTPTLELKLWGEVVAQEDRYERYALAVKIAGTWFVNMHPTPLGFFGRSYEEHEDAEGAAHGREIIEHLLRSIPDGPVVFGADFNTDDVRLVYQQVIDELGLRVALDSGTWTVPGWDGAPDQVLASAEFQTIDSTIEVTDTDHYPVVADLWITDPELLRSWIAARSAVDQTNRDGVDDDGDDSSGGTTVPRPDAPLPGEASDTPPPSAVDRMVADPDPAESGSPGDVGPRIAMSLAALGIHSEAEILLEAAKFIDLKYLLVAIVAGQPEPERLFGDEEWAGYLEAVRAARKYGNKPLTVDFIVGLHKILAAETMQEKAGEFTVTMRGNLPWPLKEDGWAALRENPLIDYIPQSFVSKFGKINYPDRETIGEVREWLEDLCDRYNEAVMDPAHDPVGIAAWLKRELISGHPFYDQNGRLSRILMNWSLENQGLSPSIIREPEEDILTRIEDWVEAVGTGIALFDEWASRLREMGTTADPVAIFGLGRMKELYFRLGGTRVPFKPGELHNWRIFHDWLERLMPGAPPRVVGAVEPGQDLVDTTPGDGGLSPIAVSSIELWLDSDAPPMDRTVPRIDSPFGEPVAEAMLPVDVDGPADLGGRVQLPLQGDSDGWWRVAPPDGSGACATRWPSGSRLFGRKVPASLRSTLPRCCRYRTHRSHGAIWLSCWRTPRLLPEEPDSLSIAAAATARNRACTGPGMCSSATIRSNCPISRRTCVTSENTIFRPRHLLRSSSSTPSTSTSNRSYRARLPHPRRSIASSSPEGCCGFG